MRKFQLLPGLLLLLACTPLQADIASAMRAYEHGDFATALRELTREAEQGHLGAQYMLGVAYSSGRGVAVNENEALRWFLIAAAKGHADAQYAAGYLLAGGRGLPRNDAEAAKWYGFAAAQNHAPAQYGLGKMLQEGRGLEKNAAAAAQHFKARRRARTSRGAV